MCSASCSVDLFESSPKPSLSIHVRRWIAVTGQRRRPSGATALVLQGAERRAPQRSVGGAGLTAASWGVVNSPSAACCQLGGAGRGAARGALAGAMLQQPRRRLL